MLIRPSFAPAGAGVRGPVVAAARLLVIPAVVLLSACSSMMGADVSAKRSVAQERASLEAGVATGASASAGTKRGGGVPVITNSQVTPAQQQANVNAVLSFYEAGINEKDFDKAAPYFGPHYIQHNPTAEDGIEGFRKFIGFLKERYPQSRSEIRRAFASGDFVILHVLSRRTPDATGSAIVDIFRLEQGKIVEHWDVIQPIPDKAANSNTMF